MHKNNQLTVWSVLEFLEKLFLKDFEIEKQSVKVMFIGLQPWNIQNKISKR